METLVMFLEEPSAKRFLEVLHKRLALPYGLKCHPFNGKSDLKGKIHKHLKSYMLPHAAYIIMCDKDGGDCIALKEELKERCKGSGKEECCTIRIACAELESFFLGDLAAVAKAYNMPKIAKKQSQSGFRDPDNYAPNPSQLLAKLTENKYLKSRGPQVIAEHMDLENYASNKSSSFRCLIRTLLHLKDQYEAEHTSVMPF